MVRRWLVWLLAAGGILALGLEAWGDAGWSPQTFVFASRVDGAALLETPDTYTDQMTALDRAARLKTDRAVSEAEFLHFAADAVRPWTAEERATLQQVIAKVAAALNGLHVPAPPRITLIKTSGKEEGEAAYTRGTAIVLPELIDRDAADTLQWLLAHETFHVVSRLNPALREQLYAAIGFVKVEPFPLPAEIAARIVSNPDGLDYDHFVRVTVDDEPVCAAPVLMFKADRYDTTEGGAFFGQARNPFLVSRHIALRTDGVPNDLRVVPKNRIFGLHYRIGENTSYTLHPDEILAENFALLATGLKKPLSPRIIEKIRAVFARNADPGATPAPEAPPPCP